MQSPPCSFSSRTSASKAAGASLLPECRSLMGKATAAALLPTGIAKQGANREQDDTAPVPQGRQPAEDDAGDGVAHALGGRVRFGVAGPEDPEDQRDRPKDEAQARDQAEDATVIGRQGFAVLVRDQRGEATVPAVPAAGRPVLVIVLNRAAGPAAGGRRRAAGLLRDRGLLRFLARHEDR